MAEEITQCQCTHTLTWLRIRAHILNYSKSQTFTYSYTHAVTHTLIYIYSKPHRNMSLLHQQKNARISSDGHMPDMRLVCLCMYVHEHAIYICLCLCICEYMYVYVCHI